MIGTGGFPALSGSQYFGDICSVVVSFLFFFVKTPYVHSIPSCDYAPLNQDRLALAYHTPPKGLYVGNEF